LAFQQSQPVPALCEAEYTVQGTGQKVFDLTFHAAEDGAEKATSEKPD